MAEVICVGNAVLDHVYEVPDLANGDATLFAGAYRQAGDGTAANAAVTASRLGGNAALWTSLGNDETGDLIVADLVRNNVDTSDVRRVDRGQSPISSVIAAADGLRQVTRFDGIGLRGDSTWLPIGRIQDTSAVIADPVWAEGAHVALDAARDARIPGILAIDTLPRPVSPELARCAGFLIFSPTGLAQFCGAGEPEKMLAEAHHRTGALVGVTSGADGFLWLDKDGEMHHQPRLAIGLVDPAATWEVFCGAFALALGEDKDTGMAVRFAVTAAGLAGSEPGGRSAIPERSIVWQRLEAEFGAVAGADG